MTTFTYTDLQIARAHTRDVDRNLLRMQAHMADADLAGLFFGRARDDVRRAAERLGFVVSEKVTGE